MNNMGTVEIIKADYTDLNHQQAIVALVNEYIADEMGGGEQLTGQSAKNLISGLQSTSSAFTLFAIVNNDFAGLTNCFINFATFRAKPLINIHDIIVDERYRGRGIGRLLMNGVIEKARELDCAKVTLEVRNDNLLAQNLYKSLNFAPCEPDMYFWVKTL